MLLLVAIGLVAAAKYTPGAAASSQHRLVTIGSDAVAATLSGMNLTQLAIGVLSVLVTAGAFASFLAGQHFLSGQDIALTLSSPGVLRCLAGAGVYLALVSVLGVALGALTRSVAGGIAPLVVLLMLLDVLADLLPASWAVDAGPYLPGVRENG